MTIKKSILSFIILFTSSFAKAEIPQNVLSCATTKGFSHRIFEQEGLYKAYVQFPLYLKSLVGEELELAKKEWKEWDGTGEQPKDRRRIKTAIPVENSNILTFDKDRLLERINFLESLFPDYEASSKYIPFDAGTLNLKFEKENCVYHSTGKIAKIICQSNEKKEINNVLIDNILMEIEVLNVERLSMDVRNNSNMVVKHETSVETQLVFVSGGETYRSAYTYSPVKEDQCLIEGKKVN